MASLESAVDWYSAVRREAAHKLAGWRGTVFSAYCVLCSVHRADWRTGGLVPGRGGGGPRGEEEAYCLQPTA